MKLKNIFIQGVLGDRIIEVTVKNAKDIVKLKLRKIRFYDRVLNENLNF